MKSVILVVMRTALFIGCQAPIEQEPAQKMELEDKEDVIKTEQIDVDIKDDVVEVTIEDVDTSELGAPFSQWCVKGQTYVFESDEASLDSNLEGVVMYKGANYCKGSQTQTIDSPIGEMVIETFYYISEDQTEYWVVTDAMGQVSETHVKI